MPAYRLFDLFNLKAKTTQVVGATSWSVRHGYRTVQSNNDGVAGVAARDKTLFWGDGRLDGQDIGSFGSLIGLWEGSDDSVDVVGEGKVAGDAAKSASLTLKRAKLVGATLRFMQGQHATTSLEFRNSASSASTASKDEVVLVEIAEKTITHAAGYRGVQILGTTFTPNGLGGITPLGMLGLELNIRWQSSETGGGDDFGLSVEAAGPEITGAIIPQDLTLNTGATVAQQLIDAGWGSLAVTYSQQGGQPNQILTLGPLEFEEDSTGLRARTFHDGRVAFGGFLQQGSTFYKIGTGDNKFYSVAAA